MKEHRAAVGRPRPGGVGGAQEGRRRRAVDDVVIGGPGGKGGQGGRLFRSAKAEGGGLDDQRAGRGGVRQGAGLPGHSLEGKTAQGVEPLRVPVGDAQRPAPGGGGPAGQGEAGAARAEEKEVEAPQLQAEGFPDGPLPARAVRAVAGEPVPRLRARDGVHRARLHGGGGERAARRQPGVDGLLVGDGDVPAPEAFFDEEFQRFLQPFRRGVEGGVAGGDPRLREGGGVHAGGKGVADGVAQDGVIGPALAGAGRFGPQRVESQEATAWHSFRRRRRRPGRRAGNRAAGRRRRPPPRRAPGPCRDLPTRRRAARRSPSG